MRFYKTRRRNEMNLQQVFDEWLKLEASFKYQENTIIDYKKRYAKHIAPQLGTLSIEMLDYKILQDFFNNKNHVGYVTRCKLKEILNVLFRFAMKCGYVTKNPVAYVEITGNIGHRQEDFICSENMFQIVIEELSRNLSYKRCGYIVALYIGKYTGMRISEVFALKREDIDFINKRIYVRRKLVYADKKREEIYASTILKTDSSSATLPLHDELGAILQSWMNFHTGSNLIADMENVYLNPKQLEYTLWSLSKKKGICFHYHMLRHTFASHLVNNGVNVKVAQELMRHANINTTMNIYTHINQELKTEAIYTAFPPQSK